LVCEGRASSSSVGPARGRDGKQAPQAKHPMKKSTVQGVLRRVLKQLGIDYQGVSIHTLRNAST